MLVCNVSLRPVGRTITAEIAEVTAAFDLSTIGYTIFATLVDDPASVDDLVDAYLGEIMAEAASATDSLDTGLMYDTVIIESLTANTAQDATTTPATFTTWNPADKGTNIALSNGNLTIANSSTVAAVRGTTSKTAGKVYYEMVWTGSNFNFCTSSGCGVSLSTASLISANPAGVAYLRISNGEIMNNGVASGTILGGLSTGQTICMAFDIGARKIWFRVNNGLWNNSGSADPASNVGGFDVSATFTAGASLYPHSSASSGVTAATADFGATTFAFSIPSGFTDWNSAPATFTTWNPADKVAITLSNADLSASNTAATANGVRAVSGHSSGKYYFELAANTWTTTNTQVGVALSTATLSTAQATTGKAVVIGSGAVFINGVNQGISFSAITSGMIVGIAVDLTANLIWFRVAPTGNWNASGTANPATGAGGLNISAIAGTLYPTFGGGVVTGQAGTANFGASAFTGSVPSGFTAGWP